MMREVGLWLPISGQEKGRDEPRFKVYYSPIAVADAYTAADIVRATACVAADIHTDAVQEFISGCRPPR